MLLGLSREELVSFWSSLQEELVRVRPRVSPEAEIKWLLFSDAMKALTTKTTFHVGAIVRQWKRGDVDREYHIKLPNKRSLVYHAENYCPLGCFFQGDFSIVENHHSLAESDPSKYTTSYLTSNIRAMFQILKNAFEWTINQKSDTIMANFFESVEDSFCLEAQVRQLQKFHLQTQSGLTFDQIVKCVLDDYSMAISQDQGLPTLCGYADLSVKSCANDVFYVDDIVNFAKSRYTHLRACSGGKTVNKDLEDYLVKYLAFDYRPLLNQPTRMDVVEEGAGLVTGSDNPSGDEKVIAMNIEPKSMLPKL